MLIAVSSQITPSTAMAFHVSNGTTEGAGKEESEMMNKLEKTVRDLIEAWNRHDVDRIISEWTDDAVYEDVALGALCRGKVELRAFLNKLFFAFPDYKLDAKSVFVSGDQATVEWVETGHFYGWLLPFGKQPADRRLQRLGVPPTGRSFSVRGTSVFELRGDKFNHGSEYYDSATLMKQLGVSPSAA